MDTIATVEIIVAVAVAVLVTLVVVVVVVVVTVTAAAVAPFSGYRRPRIFKTLEKKPFTSTAVSSEVVLGQLRVAVVNLVVPLERLLDLVVLALGRHEHCALHGLVVHVFAHAALAVHAHKLLVARLL